MEENNNNSVMREVLEYVKVIVFAVIAVLIINNFVLINAQIPSESMEKTIMTGDRIFGFRLAYKFEEPERFDIVIFKFPDDPSELYIKRLIGLPGDTIKIVDGKVYVNGSDEPLDDSFCPETPTGSYPMEGGVYTVPEGCYFMLGDNRNYSKDSRLWENTYVRDDQIVGKALIRYYPSIKILK